MNTSRAGYRHYWVALRSMLILTGVLGVAYPLVMTGVAQLALPHQANGSLVTSDGRTVGSSLIGQNFTSPDGAPSPRYFQPRPSAAGEHGYDAGASGASNLGPNNAELTKTIAERRAEIATLNGVAERAVPADAVTASSSGLDPDVSPAYALLQADRVAKARALPADTVRALVERHVAGRDLGVLGQEHVNVLELNIALDRLKG